MRFYAITCLLSSFVGLLLAAVVVQMKQRKWESLSTADRRHHTMVLEGEKRLFETPEEYFRALAKSPAVLGMRKMSKDGKIIYTSPELKKIDRILDKARLGLFHLESLWNVSDALNGILLKTLAA